MTNHRKMHLVMKRAYELAATGKFSDAAIVEAAREDEGFREVADWIKMPSIRDAIVTFAHFTCQPRRGLETRTEENQ